MRNLRGSLVLIMALLLVVSACSGSEDSGPTSATAVDPTATTAVGAASPTTTAKESKEPIVIGLVTDQSGRFVTFGKDIVTATEYAVEEINAAGGVNGSMI